MTEIASYRTLIAQSTRASVRSVVRLQVLRQGQWETKTSYRTQVASARKQLPALARHGVVARLVNAQGTPIAHNTNLDVPGVDRVK